MTARFLIADVFDGLATLEDGSVHAVITSPPYWRKRRYTDDPREIGQESSPGEFLATLLRITDELWRVLRDDGTIWFNLGDTAAHSGGWGGDVDKTNRGGGRRWVGNNGAGIGETPLPKSVCWIPELFGASLAYGRNLLTGEPCRQWITRPSVTWCKPSVTPGAIHDKFREATELIVWAAKQPNYYFDLDAVRQPPKDYGPRYAEHRVRETPGRSPQTVNPLGPDGQRVQGNPKGVPPFNWWIVRHNGYSEAHFATFPSELIVMPVIVSCPPGGTILDPFAGSGTTLAVAIGNDRKAIGIDFDPKNAALTSNRIGLMLEVSDLPH